MTGSCSLVHKLFCLYFCYWMDPLNARAAWSSVVGVLEHGERSQKNVAENIFEEFSAAVLTNVPSLTCCSVEWTIWNLVGLRTEWLMCSRDKCLPWLPLRFWSPLLEQLNEVCLVLTDGSFLCPPAHQCPPRQTNHRCFAKTKWPPSVRAQWHLHLLSDKPLKVQGKISALSVHIKSLISLHQHSLPVLHSRDRLNLKTDSHTEHFDFITTRHWIFIYFFLTAVSSHTWNQQGVIHYSLVEGNGVWSNRVYWGADKPGLHFLIH